MEVFNSSSSSNNNNNNNNNLSIFSLSITGKISTNIDMRTGLPVDCVQFAMYTTATYQYCRRQMVFLITVNLLFSARYELIVI